MRCIGERALVALCAAAALVSAPLAAAAQEDAGQDNQNKALTGAYNASGQELFRQFAARPGNIVFSPYSIGSAMAMVLAGARGETAAEMRGVLEHRLPAPQIDAANLAVLRRLNGYDRSGDTPACRQGWQWNGSRCEGPAQDAYCPPGSERANDKCLAPPLAQRSARLAVANALMLANAQVAPSYADLLKDKYAAEVFQKPTLADVNGWVNRKTEGKIDHILDELSDLVLINAVYFKAHWAQVFDPNMTSQQPFHLAPARDVQVTTMQQRGNYALVTGQGYHALRMPYDVPELGMIVVLPDAVDGLNAVVERLDVSELAQTLGALRTEGTKYVSLSLPRFKSEFRADLKAAFERVGMHRPFSMATADFSGMTGLSPAAAPTAIDQIAHRAVIDVMEGGTEAAAVTAIGVRVASVPPPPEPFRVDHPFLYYIVDDVTGAILFQGRVSDPR